MRRHDHEWQRLRRKHHFLDQPRIADHRRRRLEHRRGEKRPRQNAGEEKQRVRLHVIARRKKDREDERVDAEQQKRIRQRPEVSEDRAAIARFQIARGQSGDELAVAEEGLHSEVMSNE